MEIKAHLLVETRDRNRCTLTIYNYSFNEPIPDNPELQDAYHSFALGSRIGVRTYTNRDGTCRVEIDTFSNSDYYLDDHSIQILLQLMPSRFRFTMHRLKAQAKANFDGLGDTDEGFVDVNITMSQEEVEAMETKIRDYAQRAKNRFIITSKCPLRKIDEAVAVDDHPLAHDLA